MKRKASSGGSASKLQRKDDDVAEREPDEVTDHEIQDMILQLLQARAPGKSC